MGLSTRTSFQRTLLAVCTALLATSLCIARHHVRIDLGDASTYASPFQHRCGLLMMGCIAWTLGEILLYFRFALADHFS